MSDEFILMVSLPNLGRTGRFEIKSPRSRIYNCIAWAASDDERWWWPDKSGSDYWPKGVPREEKIQAFIAAYGTLGYEPCDNPDLEPGLEKVAIFTKPAGTPAHVAKQLGDGTWTSKLGPDWDIVHHDLDGVECPKYGKATVFLKRSRPLPNPE